MVALTFTVGLLVAFAVAVGDGVEVPLALDDVVGLAAGEIVGDAVTVGVGVAGSVGTIVADGKGVESSAKTGEILLFNKTHITIILRADLRSMSQ